MCSDEYHMLVLYLCCSFITDSIPTIWLSSTCPRHLTGKSGLDYVQTKWAADTIFGAATPTFGSSCSKFFQFSYTTYNTGTKMALAFPYFFKNASIGKLSSHFLSTLN